MGKSFLTTVALLVTIGSALVVSFNMLVDPFSLFGSPHIAGFNANKMNFVEHLRITNAYAVQRIHPDALIIGTSRAARGLSPMHPVWQDFTCYNIALPGISTYEILRYLQHAIAIHPLKRVLVGLDFRSFQPGDTPDADMEQRLNVTADGEPNRKLFTALLHDLVASVFSYDALLDSLQTVRFQTWQNITLTERGQWKNLSDQYNHAKGFRAYTENTFNRYAEYAQYPFDADEAMAPFRKILELAHQHRIDLRLVILPSHAWHWETMRIAGMEPRFEAIMATMVQINQSLANKWSRPKFPLWDFSGYNSYSSESVPSRPGQLMKWFWDPVHFKPFLGDLILSKVFGLETDTAANFGVRLDALGLETRLAHWHQAEETYKATHQQDIEEIKSIGLRIGAIN